MKRWTGRMVTVGLLAGGLFATGCFYKEQDEDAGGPHTPIQQKYQSSPAPAAQEFGTDRQGLDMPDWQEHTTTDEEAEAWRARPGETAEFEQTPSIPAPQEAYQTAEDVLAPRADEDAPDVEVPQEGIGGAGGTEPIQQPEPEEGR